MKLAKRGNSVRLAGAVTLVAGSLAGFGTAAQAAAPRSATYSTPPGSTGSDRSDPTPAGQGAGVSSVALSRTTDCGCSDDSAGSDGSEGRDDSPGSESSGPGAADGSDYGREPAPGTPEGSGTEAPVAPVPDAPDQSTPEVPQVPPGTSEGTGPGAPPAQGSPTPGSTSPVPGSPVPAPSGGASPGPGAPAARVVPPVQVVRPADRGPLGDGGPESPDADVTLADLGINARAAATSARDAIDVTLTVRNAGPAAAPGTLVTVIAPTGTTLIGVAQGCTAVTTGREYRCTLGEAPVGTGTALFTFKLTAPVGDDGSATVTSSLDDPDLSDNVTSIPLVPGQETTGALPVTGGRPVGLAGTGLAAVLAGAVLSVLGRRRRVASDMRDGGE